MLKMSLTKRNANRQTGGFSDCVKTGLIQQLDCADCQVVTSGLWDHQKALIFQSLRLKVHECLKY